MPLLSSITSATEAVLVPVAAAHQLSVFSIRLLSSSAVSAPVSTRWPPLTVSLNHFLLQPANRFRPSHRLPHEAPPLFPPRTFRAHTTSSPVLLDLPSAGRGALRPHSPRPSRLRKPMSGPRSRATTSSSSSSSRASSRRPYTRSRLKRSLQISAPSPTTTSPPSSRSTAQTTASPRGNSGPPTPPPGPPLSPCCSTDNSSTSSCPSTER